MPKPSDIKLDNLTVEGLTFEVHAELDCPKNPLIFVEILDEQNALLSTKFATDPVSLRQTAEFLLFAADRAESKYQRYWKNKSSV